MTDEPQNTDNQIPAEPTPATPEPAAPMPAVPAESAPLTPAPAVRASEAPVTQPPPSDGPGDGGSGVYSHPDQPVRHSYPLAIEKAGFGTAWGLLMRTMPYAIVRFGILVGVSVATLAWFGGTFGGAAFLGARIHPWVGTGWLFAGMGVFGAIWRMVLRYVLYLLKLGHIAVITELITTNKIANGEKGMFQYGKDIIVDRFKEVNVLFGLDLLIEGVVRAFNRTLDWIARLIPIPGLDGVAKVVNTIVYAMTTYIDETIFSYNLARGDTNPWRAGRDGLVYYAQNVREILKTSIGIVILEYVLTLVAWIVMLAPAFALAYFIPGRTAGFVFFASILFAWNIRMAFLKPLFLIMIMTKFHVCVKGQAIDPTWDGRLSQVSKKFDKIKQGAVKWARDHGEPEPAPVSPAAPPAPPPEPA